MTAAIDDLFGAMPMADSASRADPAATHHPDSTDVGRPLAERLRPRTLDEVLGQEALLGPNAPLRRIFAPGAQISVLLWGPPGTGKTTLARLAAQARGEAFMALSAVSASVRDARAVIDDSRARRRRGLPRVLLFLDEIHRFNKAQQDTLLPALEDGTLGLIGATTENPSFALNDALLSRLRVFRLAPLTPPVIEALLRRALADAEQGVAGCAPRLTDAAIAALAQHADGDARRALTALETLVACVTPERTLDAADLPALLGDRRLRFDRQGDAWHQLISALHKAVRGSDPDAALYWLARMLDAGCPPEYLGRRLLRMAYEDIGLAAPHLAGEALAAWQTVERLGAPEGELALAQIAVALSLAPKSNAVYRAFDAARAMVAEFGSAAVPAHLVNAPTRLMREIGFGADYRYDHDCPDGVAWSQSLWPDGVAPRALLAAHPREAGAAWARRLAELRARRARERDT